MREPKTYELKLIALKCNLGLRETFQKYSIGGETVYDITSR